MKKLILAIFFRLRIHPKIIYVTECALGCNLIGHCLAIVVFFNDCRRGNGCRLFLLAAEDALLQVPELVILALLCQQLVMGAALHDLAVIHDQNQVTVTDGGKAVIKTAMHSTSPRNGLVSGDTAMPPTNMARHARFGLPCAII